MTNGYEHTFDNDDPKWHEYVASFLRNLEYYGVEAADLEPTNLIQHVDPKITPPHRFDRTDVWCAWHTKKHLPELVSKLANDGPPGLYFSIQQRCVNGAGLTDSANVVGNVSTSQRPTMWLIAALWMLEGHGRGSTGMRPSKTAYDSLYAVKMAAPIRKLCHMPWHHSVTRTLPSIGYETAIRRWYVDDEYDILELCALGCVLTLYEHVLVRVSVQWPAGPTKESEAGKLLRLASNKDE